MSLRVDGLDHLALTVRSLSRSAAFLRTALGMEPIEFGDGRIALRFGDQKINLHPAGGEFAPHALRPTPGAADLCFHAQVPLERFLARFAELDIPVIAGPGPRHGAIGPLRSIYIRDPDGNLLEIANRLEPDTVPTVRTRPDTGRSP